MSEVNTRSSAPPVWRQRLCVPWLALGASMWLLSGSLAYAAFVVGDPARAATSAAFAALLASAAAGPLRQGGLHSIWLSWRVRARSGPDGPGIRVPGSLLIPLPFFAIALCGVSLLPHHTGLGWTLIGSGLFLHAVVGRVVSLDIHPNGVRRRTRHWRLLWFRTTDVLLPWDDITHVGADMQVLRLRVGSRRDPLVTFTSRFSIPRSNRTWIDSEHRLVLGTSLVAAEPNALLHAIRELKSNPDRRSVLERPDARELLRPPPLRERIRLDRAPEPGHSGTLF